MPKKGLVSTKGKRDKEMTTITLSIGKDQTQKKKKKKKKRREKGGEKKKRKKKKKGGGKKQGKRIKEKKKRRRSPGITAKNSRGGEKNKKKERKRTEPRGGGCGDSKKQAKFPRYEAHWNVKGDMGQKKRRRTVATEKSRSLGGKDNLGNVKKGVESSRKKRGGDDDWNHRLKETRAKRGEKQAAKRGIEILSGGEAGGRGIRRSGC